eukprot:1138116-Pelagomonas_calceolata.AAC.2
MKVGYKIVGALQAMPSPLLYELLHQGSVLARTYSPISKGPHETWQCGAAVLPRNGKLAMLIQIVMMLMDVAGVVANAARDATGRSSSAALELQWELVR